MRTYYLKVVYLIYNIYIVLLRVYMIEIFESNTLLDSKEAMGLRAAINMTRSSSGRSGEIARSAFCTFRWNEDHEYVYHMWNNIKNNVQQWGMIYVADKKSYLLDIGHTLWTQYSLKIIEIGDRLVTIVQKLFTECRYYCCCCE